jgi:hypothetical protein
MTDRQIPFENAPHFSQQRLSPLAPILADKVRANVAAALQPQDAADELSPAERTRFIALGDQWLREGDIESTLNAYALAGANDKLIALGDRRLEHKPSRTV